MNWIHRLYEIKNKDLYSQNGEGLILEYIFSHILPGLRGVAVDIGAGDGFVLSNTRHLRNLGWKVYTIEKLDGQRITIENALSLMPRDGINLISIDIDGNDYWIIDKILSERTPDVIIAEFNPRYDDCRTIKYNGNHVWEGDSYYGFTFEAGKKLAERFGYKVIFQLADMNMFMVRADLIEGLEIPEVTYKQNDFFKLSDRTDWVMV